MDFKINVAIDFDVLSHGMHAGNIHVYGWALAVYLCCVCVCVLVIYEGFLFQMTEPLLCSVLGD